MSLLRFLSLSCLAAACALAQVQTFTIRGHVTDPAGADVPKATVKIYNRDSTQSFTANTGQDGSFLLTVPQGEYLYTAQNGGLTLPDSPRRISVTKSDMLQLELGIPQVSSSVLVTATGTYQSPEEAAKSIDTIGRDEIDRRGVTTTIDALRELPGLRISQRGGPGSFATIQTRGLRTFDTAVLIDGMRFRDVGATQGDASSFISDLLVVDASRVEVLRGSGSSIYGTNAIGGAVNLVTDTGGGPFHGDFTADGGGLGSFRGLARVGAGAFENRFHYSAGVGHQDVTDGVGGYGRYRNTTGNGSIDYAFKPGLVLTERLLATDVYGQLYDTANGAPRGNLPATGYVNAVPLAGNQIRAAEQGLPYNLGNATFIPALGDPDYYRTARYLSTMTTLQQQVSAPFSYRLSYQGLLSDRNVVDGPLGAGYQSLYRNSSQFNGRIDTLRGQANVLAGTHQLLSFGYEFEREGFATPAYDENPDPELRIDSNTRVSETSNTVDAQDQIRLLHDRLQVSVSGRFQHFDLNQPRFSGNFPVYASATALNSPNAYTGDVSIAYFLPKTGTKVRVHGGNGYRKPSLYERFGTYFDGSGFTAYGDPRLTPERSIAIDGGIDQYFSHDRMRVSATYFYTRLQQVIRFDFSGLLDPATDPFGRSSGYLNTGGGLARGAELSFEAKPWRGMMLRSSYTYTNARDKLSQFGDGTLQTPRITPHNFGIVAMQQFGKHWDGAVNFIAASDYLYPFSGRTFVFPGSRRTDLDAGYTYQFTDRVKSRFYGRVSNAGNQQYFEDGFRTPGIWAVGGITLSL